MNCIVHGVAESQTRLSNFQNRNVVFYLGPLSLILKLGAELKKMQKLKNHPPQSLLNLCFVHCKLLLNEKYQCSD